MPYLSDIFFVIYTNERMILLNAQAATVILKAGTVVSTKLGSGISSYMNIVYEISDCSVRLEMIRPYLENGIKPDMPICIRYFNEYYLYIFKGKVRSIAVGNPSFVDVTVDSAEELINTRSYPRYDTYLACTATSIWNEEANFSILTNISHGGMAFTSPQRFELGEELAILLYVPESYPINVRGKVINRSCMEDCYEYNLRFATLDAKELQNLSAYFSLLEEELVHMQERFHTHLLRF